MVYIPWCRGWTAQHMSTDDRRYNRPARNGRRRHLLAAITRGQQRLSSYQSRRRYSHLQRQINSTTTYTFAINVRVKTSYLNVFSVNQINNEVMEVTKTRSCPYGHNLMQLVAY